MCRTVDLSYKQLTQYVPRSPHRKPRVEAFSFFIRPYCKTRAAQSLVAPCDCGKHFKSSGQVTDFQLRAISFPLLVLLAESHRQGWTMSLSSRSESQRLSRACLGFSCCVFASDLLSLVTSVPKSNCQGYTTSLSPQSELVHPIASIPLNSIGI